MTAVARVGDLMSLATISEARASRVKSLTSAG